MLCFNYIFCFILVMFLSGVYKFLSNFKYLISSLLILEFLFLIVFLAVLFLMSMYEYSLLMGFVFVVFGVCESVIGISLLILMVRNYSSYHFQVFSFLSC